MPTRHPYGDRRWRIVRTAVLHRDGHRCQMRLDGCTEHATEVDHIVELVNGGDAYDPLNLRAACKHCNSSAGATLRNRRRRPRSVNW